MAKDSSRCWILWRTKIEERINCAPIAGHCAPWPVKTPKTRGTAGLPVERVPTAVPAFCFTAASLLSILELSCWIFSAEKAALTGSWLLRECRVKPSWRHRFHYDESSGIRNIAPRGQPRMSQKGLKTGKEWKMMNLNCPGASSGSWK